jgi:hypothetical protein
MVEKLNMIMGEITGARRGGLIPVGLDVHIIQNTGGNIPPEGHPNGRPQARFKPEYAVVISIYIEVVVVLYVGLDMNLEHPNCRPYFFILCWLVAVSGGGFWRRFRGFLFHRRGGSRILRSHCVQDEVLVNEKLWAQAR